MKLSEYVLDICRALETNPADKDGQPQNITIRLDAQHMGYRKAISRVLNQAFCGQMSAVSDDLFTQSQLVAGLHEQYKQAHQASLLELEKIKASKPIKPKREIQKEPKRGRPAKPKIEKAVKQVADITKD